MPKKDYDLFAGLLHLSIFNCGFVFYKLAAQRAGLLLNNVKIWSPKHKYTSSHCTPLRADHIHLKGEITFLETLKYLSPCFNKV